MAEVKAFFDKATSTLTYAVWEAATRDALVIDPVWDYEPGASKLTRTSLKEVVQFLKDKELRLHTILETHAHADHISSSQLLKSLFPQAKIAIGEKIKEVQKTFVPFFDLGPEFPVDGRQFDKLIQDEETWSAGSLSLTTRFTPGHTTACACHQLEDLLFTGDTLFMPDYGVGRCDFPGGSAETLYASVTERLYRLPDRLRTFTGHDYQPNGREVKWESTIGEQKKSNVHLKSTTSKEDFVKFRTERDKTLPAPKLLLPSIQINIAAGKLPPPRSNGKRYLNIPLTDSSDGA